jgi:hypothetical protein
VLLPEALLLVLVLLLLVLLLLVLLLLVLLRLVFAWAVMAVLLLLLLLALLPLLLLLVKGQQQAACPALLHWTSALVLFVLDLIAEQSSELFWQHEHQNCHQQSKENEV